MADSPDDDEPHSIIVDLRTKKTAIGWPRAYESAALAFAPKLYEWIGWVFLLGALEYLVQQSDNLLVLAVRAIAGISLAAYFYAFFVRIQFWGLPLVKNGSFLNYIISGLITLPLFYGSYYGANYVAKEIAALQAQPQGDASDQEG